MPSESLTKRQIELIQEVKKIAEQLGYVPTLQMLNDEPKWPGVGTVRYHFGNYTNLLKLAGLPVQRCTKRYGTNELLMTLRRHILHLGRIPSQYEVRTDPNLPSDETYLNLYPSWEELIIALGFTMNWCTPEFRRRLLVDLRQKYVELGFKLPGPQDIQNDPKMEKVHVYVQIFGDLNYAQTAAGIRKDFYLRQRKEIANTILSVYRETGRVPKIKDPGMPNDKLIRKIFGSYGEALRFVGINPNREYYTKRQLIQQLQRKYEQVGYPPTMQEIDDDPSMASAQTYRRVFKGYNEALYAAKIPVTRVDRRRGYTKEQLIAQLRQKYHDLGDKAPTTREIDADPDMASSSVFTRVFGSFKTALEEAEIPTRRIYARYSNDELIAQLQAKAAALGRSPMQREVNSDPNMASANTLANAFGSYNAALCAAHITPSRKREYNDDELLESLKEKYISVGYLETRRRPTDKEINADPDMASLRAFDAHFGSVKKARDIVEEMLAS